MSFAKMISAMGAMLLLAACFPYNGSDTEKITGPYELQDIDSETQMNVSYDLDHGTSIERVSQTVFAVGWNDKYVVAARHPHAVAEPELDKTRTEYFYIIRAKNSPYVDPSVTVRGPFNGAAFAKESSRLGLPPFRREITSLK